MALKSFMKVLPIMLLLLTQATPGRAKTLGKKYMYLGVVVLPLLVYELHTTLEMLN